MSWYLILILTAAYILIGATVAALTIDDIYENSGAAVASLFLWPLYIVSYPFMYIIFMINVWKKERSVKKEKKDDVVVLKVKKLSDEAVIPKYAHYGEDACFDLTAIDVETDEYGNDVYHFGLAFEIPKGYVGLVFPRSSCCKKPQMLTNCVGVIDSGYRGEVTAKFKQIAGANKRKYDYSSCYSIGERVCQMMIIKIGEVCIVESEELSESDRGDGGYGSTGK